MIEIRAKSPRLKLAPEAYRKLRRAVLERDAWHCQACGCVYNLQIQRIQFRSRLGDDMEENMVSLGSRQDEISIDEVEWIAI